MFSREGIFAEAREAKECSNEDSKGGSQQKYQRKTKHERA